MITWMAPLKKRFSFANVMSCMAVLLAFSGSAYAVATVTGSNVRDGSLTGRDIRDRSIELRDLSGAARASLRGQQGERGVAGLTGSTGTAGAPVVTTASGIAQTAVPASALVAYPLTSGTSWSKLSSLETDMLASTIFFDAPATCANGLGATLRIKVDGTVVASVALAYTGSGSLDSTEIAKAAYAGAPGSHTLSATVENHCAGVGEDYSITGLYLRVVRLV